jgi:hypothetical protein
MQVAVAPADDVDDAAVVHQRDDAVLQAGEVEALVQRLR